MYALHVDVPAGADAVDVDLEFLLSSGSGDFSSSSSSTSQLVDINWNQVLLYPKGAGAREITFQPSVSLPEKWKFGTALL